MRERKSGSPFRGLRQTLAALLLATITSMSHSSGLEYPGSVRFATLQLLDSELVLRTDTPVMGIQCTIVGAGAKDLTFQSDTSLQSFSVGLYSPDDTLCNLVIYTLSGPPLQAGNHVLGRFSRLQPGQHLQGIVISDERGGQIPVCVIESGRLNAHSNHLLEVHPNPCTTSVAFCIHGGAGRYFTLAISTLLGKTMYSRTAIGHAEGDNIQEWNCTDSDGRSVPSGLYLCTIRDHQVILDRRILIIHR
jgi:hypothetical protein